MEKFVDEYSEGPDVSLGPVLIFNEAFGRHVYGRAYVDILEFCPREFCEAEIGDFGLTVVNEDVGDFDVPMHYTKICEIHESLEDGFDVGLGLFLPHVLLAAEFRLQIALVTQLGDDVAVAIASEDLVTFEDVGMVEFF